MRAGAIVTIAILHFSTFALAAEDLAIERSAVRREPVADGGVYIGFGGGGSPDAGGLLGMLSLVINRPIIWRLGLWASGESMYIQRAPEADLALRLCIGLSIDLARDDEQKVRWIGMVDFAHQHEATVTAWEANPFSNLLGESGAGLGHRSGVELGTGLLLTPWIDQNNFARRVRILARVSAEWLPDNKGPNLYLSFLTSAGIAI